MKSFNISAKGKRLEQKVASLWRRKIDGFAVTTPGSGNGEKHQDDVYTRYFSIECKNNERHNIWEEWSQAVSQKNFNKPPVLVVSGDYRPILVAMEIDDWLDLVKEAKVEK